MKLEFPETEITRREAAKVKHVIADISYADESVPAEEAPMFCVCGWNGPHSEFQQHRMEAGLQRRWASGGRVPRSRDASA